MKKRNLIGSILSAAIVSAAVALGLIVINHNNHYPRTDDSEILANFIGIAPQVEGPIVRLHVRDNSPRHYRICKDKGQAPFPRLASYETCG